MGELMNQMMGSSATALSQMINRRIDISPPKPLLVANSREQIEQSFLGEKKIVRTTFTLSIEGKGDSQIMQLMPVSFARELVDLLKSKYLSSAGIPAEQPAPGTPARAAQASQPQPDRPEEVKVKYVQFRSFGEEKTPSVVQQSRYDYSYGHPAGGIG
jgi:flagellar motor switch protein FliN/FliY